MLNKVLCEECNREMRLKIYTYNKKEYLLPYCKKCKSHNEADLLRIKRFSETLDKIKQNPETIY